MVVLRCQCRMRAFIARADQKIAHEPEQADAGHRRQHQVVTQEIIGIPQHIAEPAFSPRPFPPSPSASRPSRCRCAIPQRCWGAPQAARQSAAADDCRRRPSCRRAANCGRRSFTPWMVLSRIGKNAPRNTRKIAGLLAMPNQTMASGIQDTGGIGRSTCSVGSITISIARDQPIAIPSVTARAPAMAKPASTRARLAAVS